MSVRLHSQFVLSNIDAHMIVGMLIVQATAIPAVSEINMANMACE